MNRLLQSLSSFAARALTHLAHNKPANIRSSQPADTLPKLSLYVAKRWSQQPQQVYWNPQRSR